MNSDTLDLGEREGGRRVWGAVGGTGAAVGGPLQPTCKGRGAVASSAADSLRLPLSRRLARLGLPPEWYARRGMARRYPAGRPPVAPLDADVVILRLCATQPPRHPPPLA
jgi:hypothetical protein